MAKFSPEVIKLAQESQAKYGVPASVTLAQYATESGYGKSWLAQNANNYFGMIASKSSVNKIYRTDRYWQVHESMADSFDKHGQLLASSTYSGATAGVTNAYDYIDAIAPIYAPESDGNTGIAALWKKIIDQNNLTQYDTGNYMPSILTDAQAQNIATGLGSGSSGSMVSSGSSGSSGEAGIVGKILGYIIKGAFILLLCVFGVVLFFNAFDLDIPTPKLKKGGKANV